jgi:hypothetical protein
MLRRILLLLTAPALLLAAILFAPAARAQSPHFVGTPTCTKSLSSGLICSGKAAGLGNGPTQAFLTASSVSATYVCQNKGRPNGNWKVILTSLTYNDVTLHIQQPPGTDVLVDNLGTIDRNRRSQHIPRESRKSGSPATFTDRCYGHKPGPCLMPAGQAAWGSGPKNHSSAGLHGWAGGACGSAGSCGRDGQSGRESPGGGQFWREPGSVPYRPGSGPSRSGSWRLPSRRMTISAIGTAPQMPKL